MKLFPPEECEFYVVDQGNNIQGAVEVEITQDYIICFKCMKEMLSYHKAKLERVGKANGS
ncbi:MAG: hypothetical protein GF317_20790 [Candidatus Lokiarchaeota archaeon]|nr:hypothetical protein [Candidatus Lokiarchaeota archaeon]